MEKLEPNYRLFNSCQSPQPKRGCPLLWGPRLILWKPLVLTGQSTPLHAQLHWPRMIRVRSGGTLLGHPSVFSAACPWRGWQGEGETWEVGTGLGKAVPPSRPNGVGECLGEVGAAGEGSRRVVPPSLAWPHLIPWGRKKKQRERTTEHLSCARSFTYISTFNPHSNPEGRIIILILQVTKMKFREVKHLTQAHTASEWRSRDPKVGLPDSQPCPLMLGERTA